VKKSISNKLKEVFKSSRYFYNLIICGWLWLSTFMLYNTFNLYSDSHIMMKDPFNEAAINQTVDLVGYMSAGFVFAKILRRKKFIFYFAFTISTIGILGCIFAKDSILDHKLDLVFLFLGKFGVAAAYQGCFIIMEIFPSLIYSSTIGVCNFLGVSSTILALFVLTKLNDPFFNIRLAICAVMIVISLVLVPLLKGSHYILIQ